MRYPTRASLGLAGAVLALALTPACLHVHVSGEQEKKDETRRSKEEPAVYVTKTTRSVEAAGAALEESTKRHGFGVLVVHDLQAKMKEKGVELANECRIYEVCQPAKAKTVLDANMKISTALPCRISVYSQGGQTYIATILPTALMATFDEPGLRPVAEEVETTLVSIIHEAAG